MTFMRLIKIMGSSNWGRLVVIIYIYIYIILPFCRVLQDRIPTICTNIFKPNFSLMSLN